MKAFRIISPMILALSIGVGLGTAGVAFADSGTASSTPVQIQNVRATVDTTHATVRWGTNIPANSRIDYGTSTDYGEVLRDTAMTTSHVMALNDLAAGTTYHFKVTSTDGTTRDSSGDNVLTTATSSGGTGTSTIPTTITNVRAVNVGASAAKIDWHTNQLADSRVEFGTTTAYGAFMTETTMTQDHDVRLTSLSPSTLYHYRVISINGNGRSVSGDYTFTTTAKSVTVPTPTLVSPANGATMTSDAFTSASWNAVTDSVGGITYVFQSSNASTTNSDGSFTNPVYTSGPLSTTTIATNGTPEGTYYWHVMASDSANNMSNWSAAWSFTIDNSVTTGAPVISSVASSNITDSGATITWNTDQAATTQVFYGTDTTYGSSTTLDSTDVTAHSATLAGLASGTTYHFMVESTNGNGNATSSDQMFTTATSSGGGNGELGLNGIDMTKSNATADGSFADGWEWVFHFTVPTNESQFALEFSDFTNGSNSTIPVANNMRYYSAQSSNATSSASAIMVTGANSYPTTMLDLTGDTASSTDGRQVDIVVQMAVPSGTANGTYSGNWGAESTTTGTNTP